MKFLSIIFSLFLAGLVQAKSSYICYHRTGDRKFSDLMLNLNFNPDQASANVKVIMAGGASAYSPSKGEFSSLKLQSSRSGWLIFSSQKSYSSSSRMFQVNVKQDDIGTGLIRLTLVTSRLGVPNTLSGFGMTCYISQSKGSN